MISRRLARVAVVLMIAPMLMFAQAKPARGQMSKVQGIAQDPMEHPHAPTPFYREQSFFILLGLGLGGFGFFAYRAGRARWRRKNAAADFANEAVLVVDLVGPTYLATQYGKGAAMQASEILHDRALGLAELNGLTFSKSTGDGFLMAFPRVSDACATAISLLREIIEKPTGLPGGARLELRAGISYGEIVMNGGKDRFGAVINKAFRLEGFSQAEFIQVEGENSKVPAIAACNRIFLDEEAVHELNREFDCEFSLRNLGFARLKGFSGLHRVYELRRSAAEQIRPQ